MPTYARTTPETSRSQCPQWKGCQESDVDPSGFDTLLCPNPSAVILGPHLTYFGVIAIPSASCQNIPNIRMRRTITASNRVRCSGNFCFAIG